MAMKLYERAIFLSLDDAALVIWRRDNRNKSVGDYQLPGAFLEWEASQN